MSGQGDQTLAYNGATSTKYIYGILGWRSYGKL